jgi:hypothetical protein
MELDAMNVGQITLARTRRWRLKRERTRCGLWRTGGTANPTTFLVSNSEAVEFIGRATAHWGHY